MLPTAPTWCAMESGTYNGGSWKLSSSHRESTRVRTNRNTRKPILCLQRYNSHPTVLRNTFARGEMHQMLPNSTNSPRTFCMWVDATSHLLDANQMNEVHREHQECRGPLKACFRWHHLTCARFPPACRRPCPPSPTTRPRGRPCWPPSSETSPSRLHRARPPYRRPSP